MTGRTMGAKAWPRLLGAALLLLLLGACTAGRSFPMPSEGSLQLGVTTPAQAVAAFGQPFSRKSDTISTVEPTFYQPASAFTSARVPGTFDFFVYVYIDNSGQQLIGRLSGVRPARSMGLTFWNGKLVSYIARSSFEADTTNFDITRIGEIERGKTRREDVISLIGRPAGASIFPVISKQEGKAIVYDYNEADLRANERHAKTLSVYLDDADIVQDVRSTDTSNPLPVQPSAPAPVVVPIIVPRGR